MSAYSELNKDGALAIAELPGEYPSLPARLALKGEDNYGKPRQNFADKLNEASNSELLKIVEDRVWLSAYANNNPRSDYHWQADACYDACRMRGREDIYREGYARAYALATGHRPSGDEKSQLKEPL